MNETNKETIKLRTNKHDRPKEIVLIQHIDKTFSFPLWLPILGLLLGLLGEIILYFKKK